VNIRRREFSRANPISLTGHPWYDPFPPRVGSAGPSRPVGPHTPGSLRGCFPVPEPVWGGLSWAGSVLREHIEEGLPSRIHVIRFPGSHGRGELPPLPPTQEPNRRDRMPAPPWKSESIRQSILHRLFMAALVVFLCHATLCHASGEDAPAYEFDEMVVRDLRARETEQVGGEALRETGAVDFGEALETLPGFWKVRKGAIANDIVLRGFQKNGLNVLIDGARMHGACPNRMDPPSFYVDLGETDRVEVFKGPFDLRHQGSLGGLVNIRTGGVPEGGGHGSASALYGSFNRTDVSGRASYGADLAGFLIGGSFQIAQPYRDGDGVRITELYPESSPSRYRPTEREGNAYLIGDGFAKFRLSPSERHEALFSYYRHEARDTLYPFLLMDLTKDSSDLVNAVYRVRDLGDVLDSIRVQAYWDRVGHDMSDEFRCSSSQDPATCSGGLPAPYSMRTTASTETVGATAEALFDGFGKTWVGVEYTFGNWDATTTMFNRPAGEYRSQASIPDVDTNNIGGYLEHDHTLAEGLTLTAGVRVDYTTQAAGADRTAFYRPFFVYAPSRVDDTYVSGNAQLSWVPTDAIRAFAGFGHTVSVPDPSERFVAIQRMGTQDKPDRVGNPGLAPTQNDEVDLAVAFSGEFADLSLDLFYSWLDDFVVLRQVESGGRIARTFRNVYATLFGGEASVRIRLPWNFYGTGGVAYVRGWNETDDTNLPEIPPLTGTAGLGYENESFYALLEGVFAASQDQVDSNLDEPATPGWSIANLRAGYRWKWLNAYAGVSNLFDAEYTEHLSYQRETFRSGIPVPEPGRTFYVGLRGEF